MVCIFYTILSLSLYLSIYLSIRTKWYLLSPKHFKNCGQTSEFFFIFLMVLIKFVQEFYDWWQMIEPKVGYLVISWGFPCLGFCESWPYIVLGYIFFIPAQVYPLFFLPFVWSTLHWDFIPLGCSKYSSKIFSLLQ